MRSLPSRTCARIAPWPAVEASVYNRNGRLKSGKAVMGLGGEEGLEAVEGVLALWTPMEDRIFPGESMERPGNSGEIFDITPVVPGEAQE